MIRAGIIWPPYPYEAGFCVTDDTDASTLESTRAVYDYLQSKSFYTAKTVWAFKPELKCGTPPLPDSALRGVTLADPEFASYCKDLYKNGYEICLHGASAGNNTRQRTKEALQLIASEYGKSDTFVCHSKNSDNIYWEEKITALFPFRQMLSFYSKFECGGEVEGSPYYWGDLCSQYINQIRLYRTRCCNTLKRNPSMPYFDEHKPLVNGWFSATKLPIADCAGDYELEKLKKENGLTVLYQYLHRYADPDTNKLNEKFVRSVNRIADDPKIYVQTVSKIMQRLRQIQGVFVIFSGKSFWLINVNSSSIENLQITTERPAVPEINNDDIFSNGCLMVIKHLPGNSIKHYKVSDTIKFNHKNSVKLNSSRRISFPLPFGELLVNLSEIDIQTKDNKPVPPYSFSLKTKYSGTGLPLLSVISPREEISLISIQSRIIAREILIKGRSYSVQKYLNQTRMENHDNW